jgi:uncharacterized protein YebE (UPF0316 family)
MDFWANMWLCLLVCGAKILEISISSVKTVFMVKGQKMQAAFLAFVECMIWGIVISSIIHTLSDNMILLLFYGIGYAAGLYIGSVIEGKIALGTSSIQFMIKSNQLDKVRGYLNKSNQGYTVLEGKGKTDKMSIVYVVLPRKEVKATIKDIRNICDGNVFIVSSEVNK